MSKLGAMGEWWEWNYLLVWFSLCGIFTDLLQRLSSSMDEFDFFTVSELDNAADELWLLQAGAAECLSKHILESM